MRRLLCALGVCLIVGCSRQAVSTEAAASPPSSATPNPRLLVVATIPPIYCFAKNVIGNLADIEMILPPGAAARGFQPSPAEVRRILQADVIIENGFGFEGWMDQLVERGLKPGAVRIIAARGTGPAIPGLPGDPNSQPSDVPFDPSKPVNPHVWLDPVMAIKEVQNIRDALMARDPAHANEYLANENRYESTLRDLDDQVGRLTVELPKRRILCPEETFAYFLSRYEFDAVAPATPPPAADAILATPDTAQSVLNTTHLPVVIVDPMESGSASPDFYEQTTLANAGALRQALSQ